MSFTAMSGAKGTIRSVSGQALPAWTAMPPVLPYAALPQPWNNAYDSPSTPLGERLNECNRTFPNRYYAAKPPVFVFLLFVPSYVRLLSLDRRKTLFLTFGGLYRLVVDFISFPFSPSRRPSFSASPSALRFQVGIPVDSHSQRCQARVAGFAVSREPRVIYSYYLEQQCRVQTVALQYYDALFPSVKNFAA